MFKQRYCANAFLIRLTLFRCKFETFCPTSEVTQVILLALELLQVGQYQARLKCLTSYIFLWLWLSLIFHYSLVPLNLQYVY